MEIKYLNSTGTKLFKPNPIGPCMGLSKEILYTIVAQEEAKLPEIKAQGPKK